MSKETKQNGSQVFVIGGVESGGKVWQIKQVGRGRWVGEPENRKSPGTSGGKTKELAESGTVP